MDSTTFQKEHGIIGQSVEIREIVEVIQQVAPTDLTVLITGESGSGKEVIAKAIHTASKRSAKTMISVNAGAIPEGIIESELFGHEKGSFTGASETRKGYFELADNGTVFLDEIGELPVATQVKFLRVLENGEYMRVGSATPRKVNVRVIAATNKNLDAEVRNGNFREDLFFRLRSINIRIPALRERKDDIPLFIEEFAKQSAEKNHLTYYGITDEALDMMKNYHWPGNVRELRNVIDSMMVIEGGKKIDAASVRKYLKEFHNDDGSFLPVHTRKTSEQVERELIYRALLEVKSDILDIKQMLLHPMIPAQQTTSSPANYVETDVAVDNNEQDPKKEQLVPLDEMEKRMILGALEKYSGNRRLAAKLLNISERTLYRKIKEYGLI
jgi:transcriptional regulator with PAS, ATPase and Fis domain